MNVLIIEDDKLVLKSVQFDIENLGHKVAMAQSAEEAIRLVTQGEFDLIISDIMMPDLSGLSLVSVLRSVHLCSAPVIMMSALNNKSILEAAAKAGANDFL